MDISNEECGSRIFNWRGTLRRSLMRCRDRGRSAPHIAQAGANVDRCSLLRWHSIVVALWCGGATSEKPEDLVRQKARARRHHVAAAMAMLVHKVEPQRLQQMKMFACPGHRHIKEPALLVDLLG